MSQSHSRRLCPYCRALNSRDQQRCVRCERRLPGPLLTPLVEALAAMGATGAPVTVLFLVINLAVFAAMHTAPEQVSRLVRGASAFRLGEFGAVVSPYTDSEWWRLVSASFVHIGLLHLAMNMVALVHFGRAAERLIGSGRYALTYVVTGIVGILISIKVSDEPLATAGASAALFGVIGLLLGWMLERRDERWKNFVIQAVVYGLAFGYLGGANNVAHLGGLGAGVVAGFVFARERRPYRRQRMAAAAGILSVLVVVYSLVMARVSPVSKVLGEWERQRIEMGE